MQKLTYYRSTEMLRVDTQNRAVRVTLGKCQASENRSLIIWKKREMVWTRPFCLLIFCPLRNPKSYWKAGRKLFLATEVALHRVQESWVWVREGLKRNSKNSKESKQIILAQTKSTREQALLITQWVWMLKSLLPENWDRQWLIYRHLITAKRITNTRKMNNRMHLEYLITHHIC